MLDPVHQKWTDVRNRGLRLEYPIDLQPIADDELERDGFVLLARKNTHPEDYTSRFEKLRDSFLDQGGQIIYSMWEGYLGEEHADKDLLRFIGGCPYESLHTSGHAYVETIAKLIETVQPKMIVPMHTEKADEFTSTPEFAPYKSRV